MNSFRLCSRKTRKGLSTRRWVATGYSSQAPIGFGSCWRSLRREWVVPTSFLHVAHIWGWVYPLGQRVRTSNDTAVSLDSWSQTQSSSDWGSTRPTTLLNFCGAPPLCRSSECSCSIHRTKLAERCSFGGAWSATFPSVVSCFEPPALPWTSHHQTSTRSAPNPSLVEASSMRPTHREPPIPLTEF
jgi:hypothetical protein